MCATGLSNPITNIDRVQTLEEYRIMLSSARFILSGRMHSLILGKIEGCELSPWIISRKVQLFINNYRDKDVRQLNNEVVSHIQALQC
jgi:hypothetical protein